MENIHEILNKYNIKSGSHKSLGEGACVMELVSYIAGEPWSDHPTCACPALTATAIRFNDRVNDEYRQKLKEIIPLLLNSRNEEKRIARFKHLCLQSVTVVFPILVEGLNLPNIAAKLRSFTPAQMSEAAQYLRDNRATIRKAAYADAYAYVDADAYADADADAYAAATADAAADATAYAAADAAATAYAAADADADADKKSHWLDVRNKIWDAWFESIKGACEL